MNVDGAITMRFSAGEIDDGEGSVYHQLMVKKEDICSFTYCVKKKIIKGNHLWVNIGDSASGVTTRHEGKMTQTTGKNDMFLYPPLCHRTVPVYVWTFTMATQQYPVYMSIQALIRCCHCCRQRVDVAIIPGYQVTFYPGIIRHHLAVLQLSVTPSQ